MKRQIIDEIKKYPNQQYYVNIGKLDGEWMAILEIESKENTLSRIGIARHEMLYKLLIEVEPLVKSVEEELGLTLDIVTISGGI